MVKTYRTATAALNADATPQSQPVPGKGMVKNEAGAYAFAVDRWGRLQRFLILGSSGSAYYVSASELTLQNASALLACLKEDGARTVQAIVDVSVGGRAPKQSQQIFALAVALAKGDDATKRLAAEAIPLVCRTGSTFFELVSYLHGSKPKDGNKTDRSTALRGKGRASRRALAAWYKQFDQPKQIDDLAGTGLMEPDTKGAEKFAYQAVKYRERSGWNHRDLLRLRQVKFTGPANDVAHWIVKGWPEVGVEPHPEEHLRQIWAFERAKAIGNATSKEQLYGDDTPLTGQVIPEEVVRAQTESELVKLITDHNLTREMVPTQFLKSAAVWEALLQRMPITAMVRNLANMTKAGLLAPHAAANKLVIERLGDLERLKKGRVHPMNLLVALKTYGGGGKNGAYDDYRTRPLDYTPVQDIVDALDGAFYLAFDAIVPSGKRHMVAVDVSGSMSSQAEGLPALSCCEVASATALVTKRTEPDSSVWRFNTQFDTFDISPRMRLDDVLKHTRNQNFGGTDAAQPMVYALKHKIPVDVFVIVSDMQTWAGDIHPFQALKKYRDGMGIAAKCVAICMVPYMTTFKDPADAGILDIVGYDLTVPKVMRDFAAGESTPVVVEDDGE